MLIIKDHNKKKGVTAQVRNPLNLLVGGEGFEPSTSSPSPIAWLPNKRISYKLFKRRLGQINAK
jgi:hypothetical protein